ncbi:MAG: OmpA family protein [Saprospiraceae bacterium]|nr:OmpA family protein [Saprospiraceae bacterium]
MSSATWLFTIASFTFFLISCVGAGKFRTLETEKNQLELDLGSKIENLSAVNSELERKAEDQRDVLITQNTLLAQLLAEKSSLEEKVADLGRQINALSSEAESVQAQLNIELKNRNAELAKKEALLSRILESYQLNQTKAQTIIIRLRELLTEYADNQLEIEEDDLEAKIIIYNSFLFNSDLELQSQAKVALEYIASVIKDYPETTIQLEGHTDNSPVRPGRKFEDAIDLSAIRAAAVMRYLIRDTGINANQVISSGKAGFYPRVSNETPAGRALNNRVEIRIRTGYREILQLIKGSP